MQTSLSTCPECQTLILEDTELCPHCNHVLKAGKEHLAQLYKDTADKYDGSDEIECPDCSAKNREGLVRCWQCGGFLKEEMAKIYQEMQMRPAQVVETTSDSEADELDFEADPDAPASDFDFEIDDEFELDDDFEMYEGAGATGQDTADMPQGEIQDEADEETKPTAAASEPDEEEEVDLYSLAVREEKRADKQAVSRKKKVPKNSFLVKAPCGCQIRVQAYHQGQIGLCPKHKEPFMVPVVQQPKKKVKAEAKKDSAGDPLPAEQKIESAAWNEFKLAKFKPKADMFKNKGDHIDLIRQGEDLVIVWPGKKGAKNKPDKKTEAKRLEIAQHLRINAPLDKLPATRHEVIPNSKLNEIKLIQPSEEENFTTGLNLFGEGTIVLQLPAPPPVPTTPEPPVHMALKDKKKKKPKKPKKVKQKAPEEPPTRCITLTLTQYRKFQSWMAELLSEPTALQHEQIPLEDSLKVWQCELGGHEFESLPPEFRNYYETDENRETVPVGWQCQCGEVAMCEEHRAEQKFGGKKPTGLAKAKCPKCEEPFGQNPLIHLKEVVDPAPEPEPEAAAEKKGKKAKKSEEESVEKSSKGLLGGLFGGKKKSDKSASEDEKTAPADGEAVASATTEVKAESAETTAAVGSEESEDKAEGKSEKKGKFGSLFGKKKKTESAEAEAATESK